MAVDAFLLDARHAVRVLARNYRFTMVAALTLALGIGVNAAVFTAYKAMPPLRPLDADRPEEMVNLALVRPRGATQFTFSYPDYEAYRSSARSFAGLIAFMTERFVVSNVTDVGAKRLSAQPGDTAFTFVVSENYFSVLGVKALRGRTFDAVPPTELQDPPAVLISENYWQKRFGGDPSILGSPIRLNGTAVTIIGITPHNFIGTGPAVPDVWLPLTLAPLVRDDETWLRNRENERVRMFGRLAPGVRREQAQAEMTVLTDRIRPLHDPMTLSATPATAMVWPGSPSPLPLTSYPPIVLAVVFVMSAAALVLVVACANVGSLQLARATARVNELRTRASLGATRARVIRQLLTESSLLGLLAGSAALLFTWALLRVAVVFVAERLPPGNGTLVVDVTPDIVTYAYVFAVSVIAGILFGLAPALETSRSALDATARSSTSTARSRRTQDILIAVQVAVSLVLLIVGSVMIRSAMNAVTTDPGYDNKHLVRLDVRFPESSKYDADRKAALIAQVRERLASMPGVVSTTAALPPSTAPVRTAAVSIDQKKEASNRQSILRYSYVEAGYFQTVGIPFVYGGTFQSNTLMAPSVVLSESAAFDIWPGQNPVGRRIRLGVTDQRLMNPLQQPQEPVADGPSYEVIGVVRDIRGIELDGSGTRYVYLPMRQGRFDGYPILVKTSSAPSLLMRAMEPVVTSIDGDVLGTASSLEEMYRQSVPFLVSSLSAAVASTVGLFGVLLASMGIYGTVSYVVTNRTREIGIRMALGAKPGDVQRLIVRESSRPVVVGLVLGLVLAVGVSRLLHGIFFGLRTVDAISFISMSMLLLAIALLAAYSPARGASAIDPNIALRFE
ncbi:MAG TPA: ADOP family duplicated permease [Vicinamibacterales bacterium]|jgi:predicted permease